MIPWNTIQSTDLPESLQFFSDMCYPSDRFVKYDILHFLSCLWCYMFHYYRTRICRQTVLLKFRTDQKNVIINSYLPESTEHMFAIGHIFTNFGQITRSLRRILYLPELTENG